MSPSIAQFAAEQATHGDEILVTVEGSVGASYVTVAEVKNMDWEVNRNEEKVDVVGSRRSSYRYGRVKVSGKVTAYWVNQVLRSIWMSAVTPTASGSASQIYESNLSFQRYNIRVTSTNTNAMLMLFVNCIFGKDVSKWEAEKLTEETIDFSAEDVLYNS